MRRRSRFRGPHRVPDRGRRGFATTARGLAADSCGVRFAGILLGPRRGEPGRPAARCRRPADRRRCRWSSANGCGERRWPPTRRSSIAASASTTSLRSSSASAPLQRIAGGAPGRRLRAARFDDHGRADLPRQRMVRIAVRLRPGTSTALAEQKMAAFYRRLGPPMARAGELRLTLGDASRGLSEARERSDAAAGARPGARRRAAARRLRQCRRPAGGAVRGPADRVRHPRGASARDARRLARQLFVEALLLALLAASAALIIARAAAPMLASRRPGWIRSRGVRRALRLAARHLHRGDVNRGSADCRRAFTAAHDADRHLRRARSPAPARSCAGRGGQ